MNITQLIFLRPREASPAYKDEGHSLEIGLIPLQIDDVRRWDNEAWHVAHVETYSASTETNNTFHLAVLTPDGTLTQPAALHVGDQRLLHLYFSSEDFALTWPEPDECLPSEGNEAMKPHHWKAGRWSGGRSLKATPLMPSTISCWFAGAFLSRQRQMPPPPDIVFVVLGNRLSL